MSERTKDLKAGHPADKKTRLRALPFFDSLEDEEIARVAAIAEFRELDRNELLFRQGDPVRGMFFLLSGRLKIFKLSPDGKEHILHIVDPGQGFAEAALFMEGYPAFTQALQKSSTVCLPKNEFLDLLAREPRISLGIIASMSRYLRLFAQQIEDLALKDVSARLARWLLHRSAEVGRDFWELEITKGQLANQLGTVSETLSRTLRRFQDAGSLQVRGRFMKILDRKALERSALGENFQED
jgi:CRP/FNR family transcriptional regulator